MLGWIAVLMIALFLVGCSIIIGASFYQIINVIRRTPKQTKPMIQILETNG